MPIACLRPAQGHRTQGLRRPNTMNPIMGRIALATAAGDIVVLMRRIER